MKRFLFRRSSGPAAVAAALALAGMLAFGAGGAGAANSTAGHPAHIHKGTCSTLGDVEYPLSDVGPGVTKDGKAEKAGKEVGAKSDIYPVESSVTTIKVKLADIADGKHALNVHESKDKIQNYIACGNIGGTMYGDELLIGLEQLNNSGYSGVAILKSDGDSTVVTVYLTKGTGGEQVLKLPTVPATPTS